MKVTCATDSYTVGVNVTGLAASGLVLHNNGGDDLAIAMTGAFTFPESLVDGSAYNAAVKTQPSNPSQTWTVVTGSGALTGATIATAKLSCATNSYTTG